MQDKELNLNEKEVRWINAINRKSIDNVKTKEEYWYEVETYQKLFEDEYILLWVEYGTEYGIHIKNASGVMIGGHTFGDLEDCIDYPLDKIRYEGFDNEQTSFSAKTLREYIRDKGFPITFKTWEE